MIESGQPKVEIVLVDLDRAPESVFLHPERWLDLASVDRGSRRASPTLRQRFFAAHIALRLQLGRHGGTKVEGLEVAAGLHGKPELRGIPDLHFNLSHSRGWALLAIGAEPVGIDIEAMIERDLDAIAKEILSDEESRCWHNTAPGERTAWLTRCWTMKEAVLKACGLGLNLEPRRVVGPAALPGRVSVPAACNFPASEWWVRDVPVPAGFVACVATTSAVPDLCVRQFDWDQVRD